jgi:hypothetical protein
MATEAISNYLHVVGGLTKTTRERARAMARGLLAQAGLEGVAADAGERVNKLAEEILNAAHANRELLERFVAAEVDMAAGRLGFARADQVESLRSELAELRRLVEQQQAGGSSATSEPGGTAGAAGAAAKRTRPRSPAAEPAPSVGAPRKPAAKKASTRKAPAKKATSARGTAGSEGLGASSESVGSASESAEAVSTSEPPEASMLANEPGGEGLGG